MIAGETRMSAMIGDLAKKLRTKRVCIYELGLALSEDFLADPDTDGVHFGKRQQKEVFEDVVLSAVELHESPGESLTAVGQIMTLEDREARKQGRRLRRVRTSARNHNVDGGRPPLEGRAATVDQNRHRMTFRGPTAPEFQRSSRQMFTHATGPTGHSVAQGYRGPARRQLQATTATQTFRGSARHPQRGSTMQRFRGPAVRTGQNLPTQTFRGSAGQVRRGSSRHTFRGAARRRVFGGETLAHRLRR